jgi:streptogramin lyase
VVARVDPATGRVQKIRVGGSPVVAYANGAVWVADSNGGTAARIGPRTGSMRSIRVGNVPTALAAGPDVRATVLPSPASHRRGTLTLASQLTPHNLSGDPAVAWDTYD